MYEDVDKCGECGGKCCKHLPGICHPDQHKTAQVIIAAVNTGNYAIDCYEGDPRENDDSFGLSKEDLLSCVYYLRPSTKDKTGVPIDYSWGGECIFLKDDGCELEPNDRPMTCQMLEPKKEECVAHAGDKCDTALLWLDNQREIMEAFEMLCKEYQEKHGLGSLPLGMSDLRSSAEKWYLQEVRKAVFLKTIYFQLLRFFGTLK